MAKSKKVNLEKKAKVVPEFDKIKPEQRVKSIKDGKVLKKKPKVKKEVLKSNAAEIIKNDPDVKKKLKGKTSKEAVKSNSENEEAPKDVFKKDLVKLALTNLRNGIKKEGENNSKIAKNLFDDELRYGLNIIGVKIPQCPPHARKILLKHSLYDQTPDICFFIGDSIPKKGDQEETVRIFKEKLQAAGLDYIKNVMTLGQLKSDYSTHNLKLKLCHTYDIFLVESKIGEHVYSILGKHFIQKRKRPFQVDTRNDKIMKYTIENSIKKTTFKISPKSLISTFEIGTAKMENGHITDNIMGTVNQLQKKWPGGWKNISRIYLRPMQPSKVSIPIYASAADPNDVEVPVIVGAKKNRLEKLQAKLKKKSDKINLDVKAKKIARNKIVKKADENKPESGDKQNKRKHEEGQQAPPEKKKKKEIATEKISKKDKKKINSEETSQAVAVAEKLEKKKNNKAQDAPAEPEKKKKKKVEVVEEQTPVEPVKKKKSKEPAVVEEVVAQPEKKKKKKEKSSEVEELQQEPLKAKNKKSAAEINTQAEKVQTKVKKTKAKKNKT